MTSIWKYALFLGNLPPDLDVGEFLNYIKQSVLDEVKYLNWKLYFNTLLMLCMFCYLDYQNAA
jgi:hypothetical protein